MDGKVTRRGREEENAGRGTIDAGGKGRVGRGRCLLVLAEKPAQSIEPRVQGKRKREKGANQLN